MDLHALLEDRVAGLASPATTLQTDQLIQNWIKDVRSASASTPHPSDDFLSSVDWLHGDVGKSAKVIVQGLMTKDLDVKDHKSNTSLDPTVAMEMRHKKVRERRVAREKRKARQHQREAQAREAHQRARKLVELEEQQARERRAREEQLISQHMSQIKAQLRERERVARLVAMETPIENAVAEAEVLIQDEQRRQATRSELVRQLDEALVLETKNNYKLLRACFSQWSQVVMEGRGKLAKATTVYNWRLLVRVWGAWRVWVSECRLRREREEVARRMQRQRTTVQTAVSHNRGRVLGKALSSWLSWVRARQTERRDLEAKTMYKHKMDALLAAATHKATSKESPARTTDPPVDPVVTPSPVSPTLVAEPTVWRRAKDEMIQVLARVDAETASTLIDKDTVSSKNGVMPKLEKKVAKPAPKVTRPIPYSGMEQRSVAMAQRRAARLERQQARETERLESLAKLEQEKAREEEEQRRAREAKKRQERLVAKQRELEREQRQRHMAHLQQRASNHYRHAQLRLRGLSPWLRFTANLKQATELADKVRGQSLTRRVLHMWKRLAGQRSLAREVMADELHERHLVRRFLSSWMQYVTECKALEEMALSYRPRLLTRRVLMGWVRVTREERVREWEMRAQARRFLERHMKSRVLMAWVRFVPLSKDEKVHEQRRAVLRRKVATWLHDYSPDVEH